METVYKAVADATPGVLTGPVDAGECKAVFRVREIAPKTPIGYEEFAETLKKDGEKYLNGLLIKRLVAEAEIGGLSRGNFVLEQLGD